MRNRMHKLRREAERALAEKAEEEFKRELRRADDYLTDWAKRGSKESLLLFNGKGGELSTDAELLERLNEALYKKYQRQGLMVWAVAIDGRVYLRMEWLEEWEVQEDHPLAFVVFLLLCMALVWLI